MKKLSYTRTAVFIWTLVVMLSSSVSSQPYQKIIRTICYFSDQPSTKDIEKLYSLKKQLQTKGFVVQTLRLVSKGKDIQILEENIIDDSIMLGIGTVSFHDASQNRKIFYNSRTSMNVDLTNEVINFNHVEFLFGMMNENPRKMFDFTYVFNNPNNTPYFPAANFKKEGFSIGLQPVDMSEGCTSLDQWLNRMKIAWDEIYSMFKRDRKFLGIDSCTAPLYRGTGSLVGFVERLGYSFSESATSNMWAKITTFIKTENPKPVGLNGLMLPCLEDFELADEYEAGNFSIERNLFLSLQSGLGVDTYPIGIDEDPKRILEILKLVQSLSNKYGKSLSVRFVSDGKSKIGMKTNFKNQYLKDVVIRPL